MIRVTVDLWPHGDSARSRTLVTADIFNDATGTPTKGNYGYRIRDKAGNTMREGALAAFKRGQWGVWWLVAACLRMAFPDVEKTHG